MKNVKFILVLTWLWVGQTFAETTLPDGVALYERPGEPGLWKWIEEKWGWVVKSRPFGKSVAFLVGVGDYEEIRPKLKFIESDLREMVKFLLDEARFDSVYVAKDGVADADLVERYINNVFKKKLSTEDRFLFYFSGHGVDRGGVGFMQFSKAKAGEFEFERRDHLKVTETEQWSKILPARHALFLIDACNAGLGYDTKEDNRPKVDEELLLQFSGDGSRSVFTAGVGNEKAFQVNAGNEQGYSVFTRAFLDSIRQNQSSGGFVTITEVLASVERKVKAFSKGEPGRQMTPRLWHIPRDVGKDKGTFVFLNPRATNAPPLGNLNQFVSVIGKGSEQSSFRFREADKEFSDDYFQYLTSRGVTSIIKYKGSGGAVKIPATVNGMTITKIGRMAFQANDTIESVEIPNAIEQIGYSAFRDCIALTNINIPVGVKEIEASSFKNCASLQAISIPESVTSIGDSAFLGCSKLTELKLPPNLGKIGSGAFEECRALRSIVIPDNVTTIEFSAFWNCTSLANVMLSTNVLRIEALTFAGCSSLRTITLPERVSHLGDQVFGGSGITEIAIPKRVTSIGEKAFSACDNLAFVRFLGNLPKLLGNDIFYHCKRLQKIYYTAGSVGWDTPFQGRIPVLSDK